MQVFFLYFTFSILPEQIRNIFYLFCFIKKCIPIIFQFKYGNDLDVSLLDWDDDEDIEETTIDEILDLDDAILDDTDEEEEEASWYLGTVDTFRLTVHQNERCQFSSKN